MNALLIYMVKAAAYLLAFYLVYSILLSNDTTYSRNRAFILFSFAFSLVFPLFTFYTIKPRDIQFFGKFLANVSVTATASHSENTGALPSGTDFPQILNLVYIYGVIIFSLKTIIDLFNLFVLIARQKNSGNRIVRFHGFNTAGFTALGYIFINTQLSPEEADNIISHEQNHLRKNHFLDIMFIEIIKALQWFNPVVYMFNRSLRAVHEYQADQGCLNSGMQIVNYQSLLLSQVFKTRAFNLTNSFSNPSLIKKRMIMMTKERTTALANMKLILVVPAVGLVILAISAYKEIPDSFNNKIVSKPKNELPNPALPYPSSISSHESARLSVATIKSVPNIVSESKSIPPPATTSSASGELQKIPGDNIEETTAESIHETFVVVEEMPMFPGGDQKLLDYIAQNTVYPEVAKENNIQGKVIVHFCVTSEGGVSQASILKGVDPGLDKEAIRVVNSLPAFKPGRQGGKAVYVWFQVPITFKLN
jgi:TonB family protein